MKGMFTNHKNVEVVNKYMGKVAILATRHNASFASMPLLSFYRNVYFASLLMEMVALLVIKLNVSIAILGTILLTKIVHHAGENLIIVSNVMKGNVLIVWRVFSIKMESAILVREIAYNAPQLKIVHYVSQIFL